MVIIKKKQSNKSSRILDASSLMEEKLSIGQKVGPGIIAAWGLGYSSTLERNRNQGVQWRTLLPMK